MNMIRLCLLCTVVVIVCLGCGGGQKGGERLDVTPVSGEVFVDGKPATGALVLMNPETPHQLPEGSRPVSSSGQVDANGKFEIATYGTADGAPAGKYKVTITWSETVGLAARPDGADKLKGRYSDPLTSTIDVDVSDTAVTIPRIDISSSR